MHNRIAARADQWLIEETLSGVPVSTCLHKHIDHFTVLVDRTPQLALLAADLYEDFINEESISVALMFSPEPPSVLGTKFDTPEFVSALD